MILVCLLLLSARAQIYKHQKINESCPRLFEFIFHNPGPGVGHRVFELVAGIFFSYQMRSTYVFDNRTWSYDGIHGAFDDIHTFLNLGDGEVPRQVVEASHMSTFQRIPVTYPFSSRYESMCNVWFHIDSISCPSVPFGGFCVAFDGIFEEASHILREKFYRRPILPRQMVLPTVFEFDPFNKVFVAHHLRVGDRVLLEGAQSHYEAIFALHLRLWGSSTRFSVHFVFECGECTGNPPHSHAFLVQLCAKFGISCIFLGGLSVRQALVTLIRADVLVTSGSSFPALAAIYSNGLVLYSQNKDAFCPTCYAMRNYFQLSENGTLTERDELRLIAVAHERFRKKIK
jgi:hypothetical protein